MPGPFVVGDVFGKWFSVPPLPKAQRLQEIWVKRLAELALNHCPRVMERPKVVATERQFLEVVEVIQDLCAVANRVVPEYDRK